MCAITSNPLDYMAGPDEWACHAERPCPASPIVRGVLLAVVDWCSLRVAGWTLQVDPLDRADRSGRAGWTCPPARVPWTTPMDPACRAVLTGQGPWTTPTGQVGWAARLVLAGQGGPRGQADWAAPTDPACQVALSVRVGRSEWTDRVGWNVQKGQAARAGLAQPGPAACCH